MKIMYRVKNKNKYFINSKTNETDFVKDNCTKLNCYKYY